MTEGRVFSVEALRRSRQHILKQVTFRLSPGRNGRKGRTQETQSRRKEEKWLVMSMEKKFSEGLIRRAHDEIRLTLNSFQHTRKVWDVARPEAETRQQSAK